MNQCKVKTDVNIDDVKDAKDVEDVIVTEEMLILLWVSVQAKEKLNFLKTLIHF